MKRKTLSTNYMLQELKKHKLYKNEKIVKVLTPIGILMGSFVTTKSTLPQLIAINKSSEGQSYFRWSGIKRNET